MDPVGNRPPLRRPPVQDPSPPEDSGQLSVWDAASIIIGIVIGASIFKIPWLIFTSSGGPWAALVVWALGGLLAFIGALCYAELATAFPRSGGDYVYLTRAFGPWCGFLFGWAQLSVVLTASIGAMAIVFGDFATGLYDLTQVIQVADLSSNFLYASAAILVLSVLNIIGVVLGKLAQNFLTILKLLGLVAILVAGFGWAESSPLEWPTQTSAVVSWGSLAAILVLYAYGGWNDAAFVAAEVRDPRRNIPRALLFGVGLIMILYLLVNTAYLTGLGFEKASQPGPIPALLLQKPLGDFGGKAMSILVMISALGAINGLIFAGARVYATLGNEHRLFGWLGHWKPGHGAPILALVVQAIITLTMIATFATRPGHELVNRALTTANQALEPVPFVRDLLAITVADDWNADRAFDKLVSISAPIFWLFFLMTGFSLFVLREQKSHDERPFSVPLYPVVPFIFCNMCAYMLYQATIYVKWQALFPVGLVLLGLPLYWLSRQFGYQEGAEDE